MKYYKSNKDLPGLKIRVKIKTYQKTHKKDQNSFFGYLNVT